MDLFQILITLFVGLFVVILYISYRRQKFLESFGFPVVPSILIFGSPPFNWHQLMVHEYVRDMHRKYGKTWMKYLGVTPTIITIDPELIREVFAKKADHFTDSVDFDVPEKQMSLDVSKGEIWRALRKSLSPIFSSGKLKLMISPMDEIAEKLVVNIHEELKKDPVIEVKSLYQAYALDTIARCAFGINLNAQSDADNEILNNGKEILVSLICKNWFMDAFIHLILLCPWILKYISLFPKAHGNLIEITKQLITERRKSKQQNGDFIHRLTEILDNIEAPLTPDMIYAQGALFFGAGFETISTTLSTLSFNLATHPEIQEQLYQEIQEVMRDSEGVINHETINQMHFLEACICENLRMFPILTELVRCCTKDCTVNGLFIPKGIRFQTNAYVAHYWEEFFPEPEIFIPERFLKENADKIIPYTWKAFGGGNRACLGQRFAMSEMKLCMAKLLDKFQTETKIVFNKGSVPFLNYDSVKVRFVPRE